jgi:hypothetical protein
MNKTAIWGLAVMLAAAVGAAPAAVYPSQTSNEAGIQAISWDAWLAAKAKAEKYDAEGNLVGALQYYLEYIRQARGLSNPVRAAWGMNNAAYMIIKMHRTDPTVDLEPARKLLEDGLAIPEASEDCRKIMAMNLEHVRSRLERAR